MERELPNLVRMKTRARSRLTTFLGALGVAGVLAVAATDADAAAAAAASPPASLGTALAETIPAARAERTVPAKKGNAPQRRISPRRRSRAKGAARATARPVAAPAGWRSTTGAPALGEALSEMLLARTRSGEWGAMVVSLTRGDTIFKHDPDALLQPASTMKMFTSAMALDHFGPDYTFATTVRRDGDVAPDGTVQGSVYLLGSGDPSLGPRYFPDESPMDMLARQVAAAGIRRIHGDIVADATAFEDRTVPEGWQTRYLGAAYAARVSALSLNENLVWVVVQPDGKKASVTLDPATTALPVESTVRVTSGTGGRVDAIRSSDGIIHVRGTIGSRSAPRRYSLVVDDPATFTAGALRASLERLGIVVDGAVRSGASPAGAVEVAKIASPPLSRIVASMNRESINVFAELLFRSTARAVTPSEPGSASSGLAALRSFLAEKTYASPVAVEVSDGSGLSVLDRVTARAMIELLGYAHRAPWGATFHASLPVAGESETLRTRMRHTPAQGNLHAKTGTTNTVASLGGYVTARNGEVLAFALIYNGRDRGNAKATMDQMGATMAEFLR